MKLEEVSQMPTGKVIEIQYAGQDDWILAIINGVEGDLVDMKTHGYQSTWFSWKKHYTHFGNWREVVTN